MSRVIIDDYNALIKVGDPVPIFGNQTKIPLYYTISLYL